MFRLYPTPEHTPDLLDVLLASDGHTREQILADLPYDRARTPTPGALPNPKRYRDGRQLLRTIGLLYEESDQGTDRLRVTALGRAVSRWRPVVNLRNIPVLGRHAALALTACQLRNPTGEGRTYEPEVEVFPFAFIWRTMLALDGTISSEELNRALFRTHNENELLEAIDRIKHYRATGDVAALGDEVVTEETKKDRILIWMNWASFGWSLIHDKRTTGTGSYAIAPNCRGLLTSAASIRRKHRVFASEADYVLHISHCAGLPEDLR